MNVYVEDPESILIAEWCMGKVVTPPFVNRFSFPEIMWSEPGIETLDVYLGNIGLTAYMSWFL